MTQGLFDQVVSITEEYLGPTAQRFVARQISSHLHKPPTEITVEDLPKLVEWTKVTLALLTEDQRVVEDYAIKITNLVHM